MILYSVIRIPAPCRMICLLMIALFAGCDATGNGVFSYTGGGWAGLSSVVIVPIRREYPADEPVFYRRKDFTVLGVYHNGTTRTFDPAMVTVTVDDAASEPLRYDTYRFLTSGEHFIYVSYAGQTGRYAIWVLSDNDPPYWSDGGGIEIHFH